MSMTKYLVSKYSDTTMVYSNTLGIRVTKVDNMSSDPNTLAETMMKSEYLVCNYSDTFMVSSNTTGIRVINVDHMFLCNMTTSVKQ